MHRSFYEEEEERLSFQFRLSMVSCGQSNPTLLQLRDVVVEGIVSFLNVHDWCELNAVEKLTAANADSMLPKVPIV